jgi:hypothetical protein
LFNLFYRTMTSTTPSERTKRQQPMPPESTILMPQSTHNVEQDGYGKRMHPTISTSPFTYSPHHFSGTIQRSLWVDIDFSDNNNKPFLIPYQLLHFWLGTSPSNNNTMKVFNTINTIAYGITWHSFNLSIYNQATTRKRLLTQRSTTYETIDFETSQNLLLMTDNVNTYKSSIQYLDEYWHPRPQNVRPRLTI